MATNTKNAALRHQIEGALHALKFFFLYGVLPLVAIISFFAFQDMGRRIDGVNLEVAEVRAKNEELARQLSQANRRISHESVVGSTEVVRIGVRQSVLRGDASGNCVTIVRRYVADPVTGLYDADSYERKFTSEKGRCSA